MAKLRDSRFSALAIGLAVVLASANACAFEVARPGQTGGGAAGAGASSSNSTTACAVVMCLAGAMTGNFPSQCEQYTQSYFSIQKFKNGIFSPTKTASARMSFLNSCSASDSSTRQSVNNQYGGLLNGI